MLLSMGDMNTKNLNSNTKHFHIVIESKTHPFFKALDWVMLQKIVNHASQHYKVDVHALVMMDTHTHLLVESFKNQENFFLDYLNRKLNTAIPPESHCEPIDNYDQYINTYKYIYNNPVKAGISLKCETYPYSSLPSLLGKQISYCSVVDKMNLIQNPFQILNWLNSQEDYKVSKLKEVRQESSFLT